MVAVFINATVYDEVPGKLLGDLNWYMPLSWAGSRASLSRPNWKTHRPSKTSGGARKKKF
jgi:hypothetical protein